MTGESNTSSRAQSPVSPVLNSSVSPRHRPNNPTPGRQSEVNRYFPENIVARISHEPWSAGAVQERLERLDRETDRLVNIIKGAMALASGPVMGQAIFTDLAALMYPTTVGDLATLMYLNSVTDLVIVTDLAADSDSATVRDSATVTDRATVTGPALGTDSGTGTESAYVTELATIL